MCLIIAPGRDGQKALMPREAFDYTYSRNNDGFGAMWTEDGRVNHIKTIGLQADEIYAYMKEMVEKFPDIIFHMRLRTHGKITPGLCHPFRILHKSRHGKDLFMMHNGVLSSYGNNLSPGQSDTTNFKDKILIPLLTRNPDALDDPEVMESINKLTVGSRLIFLDSEGKVYKTSESSWNSRYGMCFSNEYMLPDKWKQTGFHTPTGPSSNVTTMGYPSDAQHRPGTTGGQLMYTLYRIVHFPDGTKTPCWFSRVNDYLIRSESGTLYQDRGANVPLMFETDRIPRDEEYQYLSAAEYMESPASDPAFGGDDEPWDDGSQDYSPYNDDRNAEKGSIADDLNTLNDALDDDLPESMSTVGDRVVQMDEKLRYARLVHNTQKGQVEDRVQLLSDLLGMGTKEMAALVMEDATTSFVILEELMEIIFDLNDTLINSDDPTITDLAFDPDELLEKGSIGYHSDAMKNISALRTARYKAALKKKVEEENRKRDEQIAAIAAEKEKKQPKSKDSKEGKKLKKQAAM